MYSNTFGYVHMGLRLDSGKGIPVKRYGVPHPYPLPSLWRSSHQEFSWADSQAYGIPISVEFL